MSYHRPGHEEEWDGDNPFDDENYEPYTPRNPSDFQLSGDLGASARPLAYPSDSDDEPTFPRIPNNLHARTNSQAVPYPSSENEDEQDMWEQNSIDGDAEKRLSMKPEAVQAPSISDGDDNDSNADWARRQNISKLKRYGTRKVNLVQGQIFQTEYRVPTAVQASVLPEHRDAESGLTEFSHMRYTAATCDPDDFRPENGYNLRIAEYERKTELLVCVTYYNEDKQLTARTIYGIMQNIRDICKLKRSAFWTHGGPAWKKICVVLVMDGIDPCDKGVLDMMATMGIYQDGVMKKNVNGEETVAHIFEYTTQLCVSPNQLLITPEEGNSDSLPPVQMIMCLKQKNAQKINSHRWVFDAICPILKPEVVCLIDAGTKPQSKSLLNLWQAFYNDKNVGGACGEIHAMLGRGNHYLVNPLVAAQNFEYKISNILDKPLESTFGYISVLPGAFSAYRYSAVEGRPLEQYFHGDHTLTERLGSKGINGMSIFRKNMFLAEDRILCFEVCFKKGAKWHLTYVKSSKAETDVPDGIAELMGQRRRWLNGSFAAGIYGLIHFGKVYRSSHNPLRLLALHLQFAYNILQQILTWFNLGCYFLTITIIIELSANPKAFGSANDDNAFPFPQPVSSIISIIVRNVYMLFVVLSFLLALGNKPKGSRWMYYTMVTVFGVAQIYAIIIALWLAVNGLTHIEANSLSDLMSNFFKNTTMLIIVALGSTFGLYIVTGFLFLDPWHIIHSFAQYIFLMPSFVNVINVYAFCNWHDVSWGTKGSNTVEYLPEAKAVKSGDKAVVEEPILTVEDIDQRFQEVVQRALAPYKPPKESKAISLDDQNRVFRTYLIVIWLISNVVLAWAITSTGSQQTSMNESVRKRISYFFAVLLWSNAVIAIVRFIGCICFLTMTLWRTIFNRK